MSPTSFWCLHKWKCQNSQPHLVIHIIFVLDVWKAYSKHFIFQKLRVFVIDTSIIICLGTFPFLLALLSLKRKPYAKKCILNDCVHERACAYWGVIFFRKTHSNVPVALLRIFLDCVILQPELFETPGFEAIFVLLFEENQFSPLLEVTLCRIFFRKTIWLICWYWHSKELIYSWTLWH